MTETAREAISCKDFLEKTAPGNMQLISDLGDKRYYEDRLPNGAYMSTPDIALHCHSEICSGIRLFRTRDEVRLVPGTSKLQFLSYICKNCALTLKTFALWLHLNTDYKSGTAFKYGELPQFGPHTPPRLLRLIQPDKELFLKGRRAENQGLGIAAFAYYRRVIEEQKNRIFDEIAKVSERLSADPKFIDEIIAAKSETQFTKAVESIKHGIPQALLVNGHNPLTLLHSALSEGLHDQTDEECLAIATSIREVMVDFSERMGQALKDEASLNTAVSRLLQKKSEVKPTAKSTENKAVDVT